MTTVTILNIANESEIINTVITIGDTVAEAMASNDVIYDIYGAEKKRLDTFVEIAAQLKKEAEAKVICVRNHFYFKQFVDEVIEFISSVAGKFSAQSVTDSITNLVGKLNAIAYREVTAH